MNPTPSYNCHTYSPYLLEHLRKIQPRAIVVMNDYAAARTIKRELPNTIVIFRLWGKDGDENDYLQQTPRQWLDSRKQYTEGGTALYLLNEPPFNNAVLFWLVEVCKINLEEGYQFTLVLGNWATGNPQPEDWSKAKDLLEYMAKRPDLFILGLHQYAGAVVTAGLIGGYPDNAGVEPGKGGGQNLIPPENWPKDTALLTKYHLGREMFVVNYCKSIGIASPRIIVTEGIFDDTSDIDAWLKRLPVSSPYLNVRGFKSLRYQWSRWFKDWSIDRAYFEQLKYALEVIWNGSPVEAVCLFCWGHSSQDWEQFDLSDQTDFHRLLEAYAAAQVEQPPAPYPALPFGSDTRFKKWVNESGSNYRVRFIPDMQHAESDMINTDEAFDYLPELTFENWLVVKSIKGIVGWVDRGVLEKRLPVPVPDEEEPPTTPTSPSDDELALIELRRAIVEVATAYNKTAIALAGLADVLKKREDSIRQERLKLAA